MSKDIIETLLNNSKNFVFIGEAGSGKTECSLNIAMAMAAVSKRQVHFFDMDQTKSMLRARDAKPLLESKGVVFHYQSQVMDAPTVAGGVIEALRNPDWVVLMDIGGGALGSHMIGQFAHLLNKDDTEILYIFNPFRPWSRTVDDIDETMRRVLGHAHLTKASIVANPNLGFETDIETVKSGLKKMESLFAVPTQFMCVLDSVAEEAKTVTDLPVFPVSLITPPVWLR